MIQNMKVMTQMVSTDPFFFSLQIFHVCDAHILSYIFWWFSAENNPLNDYPDEISEEEVESEASENESEEESGSDRSSESEDVDYHGLSDNANLLYEDDIYDVNDNEGEDDDAVYDYDYDRGVDGYCKDWWFDLLLSSSFVQVFTNFITFFVVTINTRLDKRN